MDALITPDELAGLLRVPASTLAQWRYLGRGPDYVKVGRHVRYQTRDVDQWLKLRTRGGVAVAGYRGHGR